MCIEEQNNFAMVLLPVTNQATTLLTLRITAQLIMYYLGRTMFHGGPFIKYQLMEYLMLVEDVRMGEQITSLLICNFIFDSTFNEHEVAPTQTVSQTSNVQH